MSEDDRTYPPSTGAPQGKPPSALRVEPGVVLKDTYRIESELGSGGMGTVFLATHLGLEKTMAVKVLSPRAIASPESLARFTREARVAGKVNHPAMTAVIDFGVEQGTPYIVMEYVDGEELADVIERRGAMPPRQAVAVMRQIVSLLHAAHALGIVHRDLKPSNIKVVKAGPDDGQLFVKVLDFGIAKVVGDIAGQLTSEGMMVGTPAYMAPEQIAAKPIDGRTDLYAAGLIFYELLSGVRAFKGDTIARILHAQMSEPPPPLGLPVPDVLRQTLEKFYAKRPEDRFQDAAEADRSLVACDEALRSAAVNPGAAGPMQRPQPVNRPDAAADLGGFSATLHRPESGASGTAITPGNPLPARPITDRDHVTPMSIQGATVPAPVPVPAPTPMPMPSPEAPAQAKGSPNSGLLKGCLIVAVVFIGGCLGLTLLGSLFGMGSDPHDEEEDAHFNMQLTAPPGQVAYGAVQPAPEPGTDDELGAPSLLAPGCYVSQAILEATADGNGRPGEPWELGEIVSRTQEPCSPGRQRAPSAQARELAQTWPYEEEILQVEELMPPHPAPDAPGLLLRVVKARTQVAVAPH
ncbi:serine/threonine-protein kinase [Hyalangium minutum]|uniref:Protein kinase domain-containing protein n=1 Tax=Hyalangium minutum TaxID=394096 RepID=A0A085W9G1_9BACT|nr:serine/threonine-protein kinase [Hyalangium minutum]KFE64324.1 hypothetical protein DB31_2118 [Hyalangium minutum]